MSPEKKKQMTSKVHILIELIFRGEISKDEWEGSLIEPFSEAEMTGGDDEGLLVFTLYWIDAKVKEISSDVSYKKLLNDF